MTRFFTHVNYLGSFSKTDFPRICHNEISVDPGVAKHNLVTSDEYAGDIDRQFNNQLYYEKDFQKLPKLWDAFQAW